jgi:hypothetical protein
MEHYAAVDGVMVIPISIMDAAGEDQ